MDLRHLRYFVTVAEEEHFGRAAQRLHIVQPALSMQIRALEEELGGALFTRTSRRVELTQAGQILLPEARRVLAQAEHAAQLARHSLSGTIGRLRLGFVGNAVLSGVLIDHLTRFRARHPSVEITLTEASPQILREALVAADIDVAYVSHDAAHERGLERIPVLSGPIVVALASDHPLARCRDLTAQALMAQPLLLYGPEGDDRLRSLQELGHRPRDVLHCSSTLGVLAAAASGLGVAIVPIELERLHVPRLIFRRLSDFHEDVTMSMLCRVGETNGAARAYVALVKGLIAG